MMPGWPLYDTLWHGDRQQALEHCKVQTSAHLSVKIIYKLIIKSWWDGDGLGRGLTYTTHTYTDVNKNGQSNSGFKWGHAYQYESIWTLLCCNIHDFRSGNFLKAQCSRVVMCLLMFSVNVMDIHISVDGKLIYCNYNRIEFSS